MRSSHDLEVRIVQFYLKFAPEKIQTGPGGGYTDAYNWAAQLAGEWSTEEQLWGALLSKYKASARDIPPPGGNSAATAPTAPRYITPVEAEGHLSILSPHPQSRGTTQQIFLGRTSHLPEADAKLSSCDLCTDTGFFWPPEAPEVSEVNKQYLREELQNLEGFFSYRPYNVNTVSVHRGEIDRNFEDILVASVEERDREVEELKKKIASQDIFLAEERAAGEHMRTLLEGAATELRETRRFTPKLPERLQVHHAYITSKGKSQSEASYRVVLDVLLKPIHQRLAEADAKRGDVSQNTSEREAISAAKRTAIQKDMQTAVVGVLAVVVVTQFSLVAQPITSAPARGCVVNVSGTVVREGEDVGSPEVARLAYNDIVEICELSSIFPRRAQIVSPSGWVSLSTAKGTLLIAASSESTKDVTKGKILAPKGVVVREAMETGSAEVGRIALNAEVHITQVVGRRAEVAYPKKGWVSVANAAGHILVEIDGKKQRGKVLGAKGAVVKQGEDLGSEVVGRVPHGDEVAIAETNGRRARITAPLSGWVSITNAAGANLIEILAEKAEEPTLLTSTDLPALCKVLPEKGILARESEDLKSSEIQRLSEGELLRVEEVVGRRARIVVPFEGWISLQNGAGVALVEITETKVVTKTESQEIGTEEHEIGEAPQKGLDDTVEGARIAKRSLESADEAEPAEEDCCDLELFGYSVGMSCWGGGGGGGETAVFADPSTVYVDHDFIPPFLHRAQLIALPPRFPFPPNGNENDDNADGPEYPECTLDLLRKDSPQTLYLLVYGGDGYDSKIPEWVASGWYRLPQYEVPVAKGAVEALGDEKDVGRDSFYEVWARNEGGEVEKEIVSFPVPYWHPYVRHGDVQPHGADLPRYILAAVAQKRRVVSPEEVLNAVRSVNANELRTLPPNERCPSLAPGARVAVKEEGWHPGQLIHQLSGDGDLLKGLWVVAMDRKDPTAQRPLQVYAEDTLVPWCSQRKCVVGVPSLESAKGVPSGDIPSVGKVYPQYNGAEGLAEFFIDEKIEDEDEEEDGDEISRKSRKANTNKPVHITAVLERSLDGAAFDPISFGGLAVTPLDMSRGEADVVIPMCPLPGPGDFATDPAAASLLSPDGGYKKLMRRLEHTHPQDLEQFVTKLPDVAVSSPGPGVVVLPQGVVVRKEIKIASEKLTVLPKGTAVVVHAMKGRRANVTSPVDGWLSVVDTKGRVVVAMPPDPVDEARLREAAFKRRAAQRTHCVEKIAAFKTRRAVSYRRYFGNHLVSRFVTAEALKAQHRDTLLTLQLRGRGKTQDLPQFAQEIVTQLFADKEEEKQKEKEQAEGGVGVEVSEGVGVDGGEDGGEEGGGDVDAPKRGTLLGGRIASPSQAPAELL